MPIFKAIKDKLWKTWQATVENWLLHHAHLCATLFALGSIICLSLGSYEARILGTLSAKLLSSPTEATPHKFGGLEAFVLDGFRGSIVPASLPAGVTTAVHAVDSQYQSPLTNPPDPHLHVEPPDKTTLKEQYVADDNKQIFLFIPAVALSDFRRSSQPLTGSSNEMKALIPKDSVLANDIRRGAAAAGLLQVLLNASQSMSGSSQASTTATSAVPAEPVPQGFTQVYIISATGALRDYNHGGSTNNSFVAHRFFPERPYFWPTVEKKSELACPTPFSFCTRPYVDLGGHGIVVTMCKTLGPRQDISDTVLCADLNYSQKSTIATIGDEILPFRTGYPKTIVCHYWHSLVKPPPKDSNVPNPPDPGDAKCDNSASDDDAEVVQSALNGVAEDGRTEEMLGAIYKITSEPQLYDAAAFRKIIRRLDGLPYIGKILHIFFPLDTDTAFAFTVPLEVNRQIDGSLEKEDVSFLVCSVDFEYPTLWLIASVVGGTVCVAGLFLSLFYSFQARRKAFAFIASLTEVMEVSPVPFLHLSEDGKIVGSNVAFRRLMDLDATTLAVTTLFSLLDQPSQARYQIVSRYRREKLLTRPYEVTLKTKNGQSHKAVVSGSALDMPRTSEFRITEPAATFLHTFGIVIPRDMISQAECDRLGVLSDTLDLQVYEELLRGSAHPASSAQR
jgi:PAS domain-containing protein